MEIITLNTSIMLVRPLILTATQRITILRLRRMTCVNIFFILQMNKYMIKVSLEDWAEGMARESEKKK